MGVGSGVVLTHSMGAVRGRIISVGADWVDLLGLMSGVAVDATTQIVTIPTVVLSGLMFRVKFDE